MKIKLVILSLCLASILTLTNCVLPGITGKLTSSSSPSTTNIRQAGTQVPASTMLSSGVLANSPLPLEELLVSLYQQGNPSVVNIQVIEKVQTNLPNFQGLQIPPGEQFNSGLGSGFIWDTDGHIITNNHVVSGADSISVTFSDGATFPAKVIGTDPDSDLAVIKVDAAASQLRPVQLADYSTVKVGQLAIAIGNPFGLQGSMTVGFVSSLGRLLPSNENALGASYSIPDIIQTDASINPGNSGGVLLNSSGLVIGVTAAIATESGSSAGVGFAIPSSIVQKVVPSLIKNGRYDHPWLGVSVTTLTPDIANTMNLKVDQRGAMVQQVMPNSPAEKAGLQASQRQVTINGSQVKIGGDVIIAFGSQTVKSTDDLIAFLSESGSIGQTTSLTVLRDNKEIQVPVTLAVRPSS